MNYTATQYPNIAPPLRLLALLSITYNDNFPLETCRELLVQIDQEQFKEIVNHACTWPIVYQNIKRYNVSFSQEFIGYFANRSKQGLLLNLRNHYQLKIIFKAFEEQNIRVYSLKGTPLAEKLYTSIALRHSSDIDLLVQIKDLPQCVQVLEKLGYRHRLSHLKLSDLVNVSYESKWFHSETKSLIELHWRLDEVGDNTFTTHIWALTSNKNRATFLLDDEELLIYLCLHGGRHLWEEFKWLTDIYQLLVQQRWNWERLLDKAYDLKCEKALVIAVLMVEHFYRLPIPEPIQKYFQKSPSIINLYHEVFNFYYHPSTLNQEKAFNVTQNLRQIKKIYLKQKILNQGAISMIRQFFRPTKREFEKIKLPKILFFIYYLVRPFRITTGIVTHYINKFR